MTTDEDEERRRIDKELTKHDEEGWSGLPRWMF